jgi:hypothetical protein
VEAESPGPAHPEGVQASEHRSAVELSRVAPHVGKPVSHGRHAADGGREELGHSDTRMVEKHYGHLAPSYVSEAVRKYAPKFGKVPSNVRAL